MCGLCVCQFFLQVRKACFVYSSVYDMMTSANEVFASDCHSVSIVTQNVVNELLRNYLQAISLGT